jgi:putative aldouronate transport system permease protein
MSPHRHEKRVQYAEHGEARRFHDGPANEFFKNRSLYLMAVPAIAIFFVFAYIPLVGIVVAFKDYQFKPGIFGSPFVGFKNFIFFFTSSSFFVTTRNTLWINFNNILWGTLFAVVFAIFLNEMRNERLKNLFQTLMFLPYFFSAVIVGRYIYLLFNQEIGIVNQILHLFGIGKVFWYSEPKYWVPILVGTDMWMNVGYSVIIYLSTITAIDSELFDAAGIDGATGLQQIRYITLPSLLPTIITLVLLAIGRIFFGNFQLIYAITGNGGSLISTTDVIETYIYRSVMYVGADYGVMGAVGLYQSCVGFMLVLGSNLLVRKYNKDYALF